MTQPEQLGKYALIEKIGVGGMAEVWLARASGPGGFAKGCVVKMVRPGVDQVRFANMFMDEARLAALLNHPNIVQIFDFGDAQGRLFIAMEFIQGRTLRALMKKCDSRGIKLPLDHACRILGAVLDGLEHAHSLVDQSGVPLNVIHRDVSPENVMLTYAGVPKLLDFGIAKATLSTDRTRDGRAKGKLSYMSPEQLMGAQLDHRVDLWACGVLLYELTCGRHPFPITNAEQLARAILDDPITHPQKVDPSLPDELGDILIKALAKEPAKRYSTAREMREALDAFLQTLTASTAYSRLDQLLATVWSEEMEEDASRSRKAAGAGALSLQVSARSIPPVANMLFPDDGENTIRDPRPDLGPAVVVSGSGAAVPKEPSLPSRVEGGPGSGPRPHPAPPDPTPLSAISASDGGTISLPQLPAPPLPSGENLLSTDERKALDHVFSGDIGLAPRHLEPTGPLSNPDTTSAAAAPTLVAPDIPPSVVDRPAPIRSDPSMTGPVFNRRVWHVPKLVGVSGLTAVAVIAAAVSGAVFFVMGNRAGTQRVVPPPPPRPATLSVEGRDQCGITVDGKGVGNTPIKGLELPTGTHAVQAQCGDATTVMDVLVMEGRDVLLALPAEMGAKKPPPVTAKPPDEGPNEGYLVVVTRKPGTLYLDGKRLGDVPQKPLALAPGKHTVRVVTKDKKDRSLSVDVARGKTSTARFQ
jgi:serine/threonine protein kinase